MPKCKHF